MNKKLTLSLNETTIDQAKHYAERNRQSLSEMVENYFRYLTKTTRIPTATTTSSRASVAELQGIISVPDSLDEKFEYREHRARKALHG